MKRVWRQQERAAGQAIERHAPHARALGPGRWEFDLENGKPLPVTTRIEDEWLVLRATPPLETRAAVLWRLARLNAEAAGGARIALSPARESAYLEACIALDEDVDIARRVDEALGGIANASAALEGVPRAGTGSYHSVPSAPERGWAALVAEAGWVCKERPGGKVAVDLEAPAGLYRADLGVREESGVEITVDFVAVPSLSATTRAALGLLLLTASSVLRLGRGAATSGEDRDGLSYRVSFASTPSATEMSHALSACSLACRWFGRELKALTDERLAQAYLEIRGWRLEHRARRARTSTRCSRPQPVVIAARETNHHTEAAS